MSKDSSHTYIHFASSRFADLFEDFTKPHLPAEEIFVPSHLLPPNPEDEDDVVPDQHAAFGIQRATQARKEPAWKDLGLEELMTRGPSKEELSAFKALGKIQKKGTAAGGAVAGGMPR